MIRIVKTFPIVLFLLTAAAVSQSKLPRPASTEQNSASASSSEVEVVGCLNRQSGKLQLTDENGNVYDLRGRTAEIKNHVGDELSLRGLQAYPPTPPAGHFQPETTLTVTSAEVMVHRNPEGVRPVLGGLDAWATYTDPTYGVRFRYPASFELTNEEDGHVQANFAGQEKTASLLVKNLSIPREAYPSSNFVGGAFAVIVDPNIQSEGTCRQFRSFWPEHTSSTNIHGIKYTQTLSVGVAAGTVSDVNYFHTFQNGLCYEFDFDFDEENNTGTDLPCSMQWVSDRNESELMQQFLSQISFLTPQFKRAPGERTGRNLLPSIASFEHGPVTVERGIIRVVDVSWSTKDVDYVQLRYPCVKYLYVSVLSPGGEDLKCGDAPDSNFPPLGSRSLMLNNFTPALIQVVLTLEPFLDGVGHPKQSKTISISVDPRPHVWPKGVKPGAQEQK